MRFPICLLACALFVAAMPGVATAATPPKGKYDCTISGVGGFGTLVIKSKKKYKRGYDPPFKGGKYKNPKGKQLRFKTGPLKGFRGNWHRTDDGGAEIQLRNPIDDFESIYCLKRS